MNNQQLIKISNSQSDSEKIDLIVEYLYEITSILTHFKGELDILKINSKEIHEVITNNTTLLGHVNQMLDVHNQTINTLSDHLTTFQNYLDIHDQHLENIGRHLDAHSGRLDIHSTQLELLFDKN